MTEPLRGFSFPFRIDPATGGVAPARDDEKLEQNLIHILMTGVGERLMRRDYGGGLRQLVHDPINTPLVAVVQHQLARAIGRFEPRVMVQDLQVSHQDGTLRVFLQYVVRRTRQVKQLSVPIGLGTP